MYISFVIMMQLCLSVKYFWLKEAFNSIDLCQIWEKEENFQSIDKSNVIFENGRSIRNVYRSMCGNEMMYRWIRYETFIDIRKYLKYWSRTMNENFDKYIS